MTTQQSNQSQNFQKQIMSQLTSLIQKAAQELQKGKPGESCKQLKQLVKEPQLQPYFNQLKQDSQVQEILSIIDSQVPDFAKCGKKLQKKKPIKASCGCKTKNKIMRVGGKVVEVTVDCNGNIVKAAQGTKVRKGEVGINQLMFNSNNRNALTNKQTGMRTGDYRYYMGADNKLMRQNYDENTGWGTGTAADFDNDFQAWYDNQVGAGYNPFINGFTYKGNGQGIFDTEANAQAVLGNDLSQYANDDTVWWGRVKGNASNQAYTSEATGPTAQQAVDQLGYRGALQEAKDISRASIKTARQNFRDFRKGFSANNLWNKKAEGKDMTTRQVFLKQKKDLIQAAKNQRVANLNAIANTWLGQSQEVKMPILNDPGTSKVVHATESTTPQTPKPQTTTALSKKGSKAKKHICKFGGKLIEI